MRKRALIIVNQHYQDPGLSELPGAAADAEQLKGVLADPAIGGFTVDVVAEGTAHACRRAIQGFFADAEQQDILLLHLSCHGRKDSRNRLHFAAADTEIALLEATSVSAEFLADQMDQSRSSRTVTLLDCYSGAFSKGLRTRGGDDRVDVAEPFSGRAQVVITSSTSLQFSYENEARSRETAEPSVFTSAVVEGLRDGSADRDQDGYVSSDDLYAFVYDRVSSVLPQQTPTRSVNAAEGKLYLARNPYGLAAGTAMDDELLIAVRSSEAWPRIGALHELERLLANPRADVRRSAREALLHLVHADHTGVAQRAARLWRSRGLGEIPNRRSRIARTIAPGSRTVAIDFGTTNSSVAVCIDGEVEVIPNRWGLPTTPSLVAVDADGNRFFGANAARMAESNLATVIRDVKLALGSDWSFEHQGTVYTAEEVASWILGELRKDAEAEFGQQVTQAVMTVPATFTTQQRAALAEAARLAGITVIRVINEPTAAAMSFSLEDEREEMVVVFDLGGGTLDVTLVEISDSICDVKATDGDRSLGGANWDRRIAEHLATEFTDLYDVELHDPAIHHRLLAAAERAKIELSHSLMTRIALPHLVTTPTGPLHLDTTLTRARLDELTADLLGRCRATFDNLFRATELSDHPIRVQDVDRVVLVGGASRIPAVADLVRDLSGDREPDRSVIIEGVVVGAALQSGVLTGEHRTSLLLDVTSHSLGIQTRDGRMVRVLDRNTTIPAKRSELFTNAVDGQETIEVTVLEGEHEQAARNVVLGSIRLSTPHALAKGLMRIEVSLDVDANGIVLATAVDLSTGTSARMAVDRHATDAARHQPPCPEYLPTLPPPEVLPGSLPTTQAEP